MNALTVVLFVAGMAIVVVGAEALVRGASRLALSAGISPLVVGLTVVAFGTSSPELAVSISAVRGGQTDIAIGNAVGSNIMNVLVILGLCAVMRALLVAWRLIRLEVPIMIGTSVLLWLLVLDGRLGRPEAGVLFAAMIGYTAWAVWASRRETAAAQRSSAPGAEPPTSPSPWYVNAVLVVAGLGLLILGSRWMVDGAVELATALGLPELIIGLTIVAFGTSLPELATSVLATIRGEREIAVGNVIGSNIFNILGVLGLSGLLAPEPLVAVDAVRWVDIPVMVAVAAVCLPVFYSGRNLMHRWEGAMFVTAYGLYVTYLVWNAQEGGAAGWFVNGVRFGLVPAAVVAVVVTAWRDRHHPIPEEALR